MNEPGLDVRIEVRLDKWLWAARFFKVRSLATEAVKGGHVWVNGERAKAAKAVRIGDKIVIRKRVEQFTVTVTALTEKRGSASIARTLYKESEDSIAGRERLAEQFRFKAAFAPSPEKRPDKRARRQLTRLKGNQG